MRGWNSGLGSAFFLIGESEFHFCWSRLEAAYDLDLDDVVLNTLPGAGGFGVRDDDDRSCLKES